MNGEWDLLGEQSAECSTREARSLMSASDTDTTSGGWNQKTENGKDENCRPQESKSVCRLRVMLPIHTTMINLFRNEYFMNSPLLVTELDSLK